MKKAISESTQDTLDETASLNQKKCYSLGTITDSRAVIVFKKLNFQEKQKN
jgi:hypothetical protein